MMQYKHLFVAGAILFVAVFFVAAGASAENPFASLTFPISELGNCGSFDACKTYCDDLSHIDACAAYGKAHGLIKSEDAEKIRHLPKTGPGGCTSEDSCRSYCEDESHSDECVAFAEKNNLISQDDASRMKQFKNEGGPGGCRNREACNAYCNDPNHIDECVSFGEKHGIVSSQEAERVRALAGKPGPGGCRGEACREYCNDPAHTEECIAFGEANGFITHEEALRAKKFIGKTGPGGCQGEACREYCNDPAHQEACLQFAEENGLIGRDEAERAKKFMDAAREGGPGGCRGEACKEYCGSPEHRDECFQFAKEHGIITDQDEQSFEAGQKIGESVQKIGGPGGCKDETSCREYCSDPAHIEECLAYAAVHGGISKEQAERMLKEFIQNSKQEFHRQEFQGGGGFSQFQGGPGSFGAPGEQNGEEFPPKEDFQKFEQEHFDRFRQFEDLEKKLRGGPGGFQNDNPGKQFSACVSDGMQADYVCGVNGKGARPGVETTYFNGCHAQQHGAEILHQGVCVRKGGPDIPCSDVAHPVCGTDNAIYVAECYAKEHGAGVKHPGICTREDFGNAPPGAGFGGNAQSGGFTGPGGCTSYETCKAYCIDPAHQSECQTFHPGGSGIPSGAPSNISPNTQMNQPAGAIAYPCNSYDSCKIYCADPSHQAEFVCVKMLQSQPPTSSTNTLLPSGGGVSPPPPSPTASYPCNSYDSCKSYCSDVSHQQEDICVKFLQYQPQSNIGDFGGGFAALVQAAFDLFREGAQ